MTRTGLTRIHSRIGTTPGKHACFARPLCRRVIILSWGITEITVRTADTGDSSLRIPSRERHLSYTGHGHTGKDSSTWWINPKGPFHLGFFWTPSLSSFMPSSIRSKIRDSPVDLKRLFPRWSPSAFVLSPNFMSI